MTIETLAKEFEHEVGTTRNHLERLPADKLDWRPHRKSFTVRGLASHIVECVGWADAVLGRAEVDVNPATFKSFEAGSTADLLSAFDGKVADGKRVLAAATEADLLQPWRLRIAGRVRIERPKSNRVPGLLPEPPDSSPGPALRVPAPARRSVARLVWSDRRQSILTPASPMRG